MARILIVHYSRSGHTARLAEALAWELRRLGHTVEEEAIRVRREWNKWLLPLPLLPLLPFLPFYLLSRHFRQLWHHIYYQPRQEIFPLLHADVSDFDLVLLGTPKWLYLSYPVARWIDTVRGIEGKRVACFATFCGPPLRVFEIEMLFEPLQARLRSREAISTGRLAVSSDYHEYFFFNEMRGLFRWLSLKAFGRPLSDFTLDGEIGQSAFRRFCDELAL